MSNEVTAASGSAGELVAAEIVSRLVIDAAYATAIMPPLCRIADISAEATVTVEFPKWPLLTASDLTDGTDAANMLFHVVNDRHKRKRSMLFTTNKPLASWGGVLHDEDLAQAIVDRVLERGRLLHLDGPSLRTKHLGLDDPKKPEACWW